MENLISHTSEVSHVLETQSTSNYHENLQILNNTKCVTATSNNS